MLTGLNVVVAAITVTAVFAALNSNVVNLSATKKILITGVAVLPAVASGLRREWAVPDSVQKHQAMAHEYQKLLSDLNFLIEMKPDFESAMNDWHSRYSEAISKP